MKINGFGMNNIQSQMRKTTTNRQVNAKQSFNDSISISQNAMQRAESSVQAERKERMQAIKVQIENGTYKVDVNQTASNMLRFFEGNRQ